ncbi:MAG: hypothetical protein HWE27_02970 [Gammaproteobacteria bacterium]|nr:hypothetical protein [Gammaproteobacteria bacterium]
MVLTIEPFAMYSTTWWSYLVLGVVFLVLVWWKIRHWNYYGQVALLSFFAAGAFSFSQVPEATTHAPAAIAFILELENEGADGEIAMLTLIGLVWLILLVVFIGGRILWDQWLKDKVMPIIHEKLKVKH